MGFPASPSVPYSNAESLKASSLGTQQAGHFHSVDDLGSENLGLTKGARSVDGMRGGGKDPLKFPLKLMISIVNLV